MKGTTEVWPTIATRHGNGRKYIVLRVDGAREDYGREPELVQLFLAIEVDQDGQPLALHRAFSEFDLGFAVASHEREAGPR